MSQQPTLIERFLGPAAASGGLHALLGVGPELPAIDEVISALERQLTTIDQHPQARTPEADEVRLALHAAAAQLLDRSARRHPDAAAVKAPTGRASVQSVRRRIEQDAIITLARYGGWNRRALRRLTMLALARGGRPEDVAGVLKHLARRRKAGVAPAARGTRGRVGRPAQPNFGEPTLTATEPGSETEADRADPRVGLIVGGIATGAALIVAVALMVIAFTSGNPERKEAVPNPDSTVAKAVPSETLPMAGGEELFPWQGSGVRGEDAPPGDGASAPAQQFESLGDALAALDSASEGFAVDPGQAAAVFARAFAAVGERWCNLTTPQQRAAQNDVVEFVYRAVQRPDLSERIIADISAGGEVLLRTDRGIGAAEVWPAAWSIGILSRLAKEQDLGAIASREVERTLRRLVGPSVIVSAGFEQGVQAALWTMLPGMIASTDEVTSESVWSRWIDAARFSPEGTQKTILSALEWTLAGAADPEESEPVREAIEALVLGCDWREGSEARAWLLRMFADSRITDADLHAVTTALAKRSRAPGVDATMTLPIRPPPGFRDVLREQYSAAWGIDLAGPSLDDLAADWAKAAAEAKARAAASTSVVEQLAAAACLSRVSEAARLRFAARLDDAGIVIDEYDRPVELELANWTQRAQGGSVANSTGMSRWALTYLSAQRDFAERLRLLNDARQLRITEAADAEVLATEAVRGSPGQARVAARDALMAQPPSAVLTLALLDLVPRMPRTPQNAELVSALTATVSISINDPDWRLKTRRVLVQTALEQLAAEGDQGIIDRMAGVISDSYSARVTGRISGDAADSAMPRLPPEVAAATLRVQWERLARQGGLGSAAIGVEAILSRHAARLGLAEGPVQTFAAEQLAAFELMAIAVAAERLEVSGRVQEVQAHVRDQRREAKDIASQIVAVESGFVDLWAIRLGQETP